MKPLTEREDNSITLNLTWPFIIWTAFFGLLAWAFDSSFLFVIALLPLAFMLCFFGIILFVMLIVLPIAYYNGTKITWTNKITGEAKTYQRKKFKKI